MEFIKPFWDEFGNSLIMLLAHGVLIGIILEFSVKKLYDSMIEKAEGVKKDKLIRAKAICSLVVGALLTLFATYAVVKGMPLPGGIYFYAFWYALIFIIQYLVSLYGIKILKKKREEAKAKVKPVKEPKPKKRTISVEEGQHLFKRLDDGTIVEV